LLHNHNLKGVAGLGVIFDFIQRSIFEGFDRKSIQKGFGKRIEKSIVKPPFTGPGGNPLGMGEKEALGKKALYRDFTICSTKLIDN
jgi:hypothetical protein